MVAEIMANGMAEKLNRLSDCNCNFFILLQDDGIESADVDKERWTVDELCRLLQ